VCEREREREREMGRQTEIDRRGEGYGETDMKHTKIWKYDNMDRQTDRRGEGYGEMDMKYTKKMEI
jgi:hypothetical protein